jgi:hypothetical protein
MSSNTVLIDNATKSLATSCGRLIFALDATASRQPSWDVACELQAAMFKSTAPIGALSVQLVFYRGDECRASGWVSSGEQLAHSMRKIACHAGRTQIGRVLTHVRREAERCPVQAVIFIGDAMEESLDEVVGAAIELGRLKVPVHTFQEGDDPKVRAAFREISLRSGGKFHLFGAGTPQEVERLAAKLNDVARLVVKEAPALTDGRGR